MDNDNTEIKDILKEQSPPLTGLPRYTPGASGFGLRDDQGNATGNTWYSIETPTPSAEDQSARIGDYVLQKGTPVVVPNSPTDLIQRGKIAIGGTEAPSYEPKLGREGLATLGPVVAGATIGGPVGAAVGGIIGTFTGLMAHNAAAEKALKDWQEENVKYDTAVEFYKDEDGAVKYRFDYSKMGAGGPRSGEAVKEAQNRETKVALGDDGRLKITVSPIFASTARFQEMVDFISENYAGLSKDTENLDEVLTEIKNGVDGEARNYVTNMKLYADFANRFPNATPETIVASYTTEIAGYVDPNEMGNYQMSVLDGKDVSVKSAKDFFDSVHKMGKDKRNELVKTLSNIVYGNEEGYSDDQRAIAYGELQSLFVVSANTEKYKDSKYQGMMDADPVVSFINNFAPLGLEISDVLSFLSGGSYSKQEYLNQNDFAEFLGGLAGIPAGFGLWKAGTSAVGAALKLLPGTSQLFQASLAGKGKEAFAFIKQAWQNDPSAAIKAWSADALFKTLQVGIFDAALAGTQSVVSGKDFWSEFGQDFARDAALMAVFSYYDMIKYLKSVDDTLVPVYTDPKTGNMVKAEIAPGEDVPERIILAGTGEPKEEIFTSIGNSGKPEEFVTTGNGTSVYTQTGSLNIRKTRLGETVGIYRDANNTVLYYDGKSVSVSSDKINTPNLLPSGDIGIDEFPALNSGVLNTSAPNGASIEKLVKTLESEGMLSSAEINMIPGQQADAAVVAGKIAKVQGTKFGSEVYKQLFNKNGMLDMANNLALAKDGDLNAWRNAQEQFVSVAQNAQSNLLDIQRGVYVKAAKEEWDKTVEIMGSFNYQYKYKPKVDGAYINAINQIQRAELLNKNRPEGDTTDYVAKALEKYGSAISDMPQDRAEALQGWLEQGKRWLKVFNESVKKSGKVDVEKLEGFMDTDIESEIGYFPVWAKKTSYKGLLDNFYTIKQQRNPYREWLRNGEWVPLDELEDPYTAMTRYTGFMTNNMGLNDRNETIAKVLDRADLLVDNTPTDATIRKRKLDSIKNKDELLNKLDEMVEAKKKEVKEKTLTPKQYTDAMTKIYEDSAIEETAEALGNVEKYLPTPEPSQRPSSQDVIPNLSYDERKRLAQKVQDNGAPGEYVLLYRVQGGKPDQWRANNRGKNGQLIGWAGEMEGFVWLTSDSEWAEGPNRASAGVDRPGTKGGKQVTNENIVVIPVKKSDIYSNLYNGGEVNAIANLKKSGKKIVQTRGRETDALLDMARNNERAPRSYDNTNPEWFSETEFILPSKEFPEFLTDSMDLMLEEYLEETADASTPKKSTYPYGAFPDYSIKPKKGYGILYTNTPNDKIDIINKEGLKIGQNLEAYGPSPDEGMYIWTDSRNPKESSYGGNTVAFQVPLDEIKQGTVNDTQVIIPHDIPREDILFIDRIYNYAPVIKASNLKEYVDKYGKEKTLEILGRNDWVNLDEVRDIIASDMDVTSDAQVQPQENPEEQWGEFWKSAPAQTRKDIRDELEKTSLQTGYGIKDTRARLNAQVPGFDVLDWSLLSREHTDGLYPGGLYSPLSIGYNGENFPVSVFILDINKLARLLDFNIDHIISNAKEDKISLEKTANRIIEETNSIGGSPLLPLTMEASSDGSKFKISIRGQDASSQEHSWGQYLAYLKEKGIEKVPVAILDKRNFSFPDNAWYSDVAKKTVKGFLDKLDSFVATAVLPEITPRELSAYFYLGHPYSDVYKKVRDNIPRDYLSDEKLEGLISEAKEYDWSKDSELLADIEKLRSKLPKAMGKDAKDITEDVKRAFSEYGQIPLFHNQNDPFGSLEFNDKLEVPEGDDRYTAKLGFGDALWISPNAKYTDQYGKNKLAGTIPIKYFMSDKERVDLITKLNKKKDELDTKALQKVLKKITSFGSDKQPKEHSYPLENNGLSEEPNLNKKGFFGAPELPGNYVIDYAGNVYSRTYQSGPDGTGQDKVVLTPDNRKLSVAPSWFYIGHPSAFLTQKEKETLDTLEKIFLSEDEISYRALAEYSGKPIIDTTIDVIEKGIADGTAYFYYKGVSPEFDEEIGQQLVTQALFDRQSPRWTGDEIANAMEEYDGMSLDEMIESVTMGQGFGEGWDNLFEQFNDGEISSSELSEEVLKFFKGVEKRYPGIGKVMQATWYNNTVQDLRDMKFKYWHPSTGLPTIADSAAAQFLEDMGERPPQAGEPVPEGQTSIWDAINPRNFANVPTEPQFVRPRKVTYEDYQKGLQADPAMAGRVQDSYRGALAQKLIKEITRVVGLAEDYLSPYSIGMDWQSNLNTSIIPDIQEAINQRMLPEEFNSFVQARMVKAIQDVAPYQSPELVLKSQLENVAQDWHDWAVKHIKSKRFTQKDLKEFVGSHNIELPNDKRPYPSKIKHALWEMVQNGKKLPKIEGLSIKVSKDMDKEAFYRALDETPLFQSAIKDKNELVDLIAAEKNGETTDGYTMGVSAEALGLGGRYPIPWYKNGKPYTRFIKYDTAEHKRWAEEIVALTTDKEVIKEEGLISRFFSGAANDFRLLMTGWDPNRATPNLARDTTRSYTVGTRFIQTKKTLQSAIEMGNYSDKQKEILKEAINNAAEAAAGSSYNSSYRSPKGKQVSITKEYLSKNGANPMKRFFYNVLHDKRSILEWPMEFAEGYSRRSNARSLAAVQLGKDQAAGKSFDEQIKNAVNAANFAGREYTANFQRKGKLIGTVSKYIAYQSSAYAGLDGMLRAFIDNPKMVARNFAVFVLAYLILLSDTLSREETRNQYYRLSEYDRENQIVIGMGDSILTIPMDQELAGLLFPYRRIMETLQGTDPVSFFEFVWGTFTDWMPMDLSGFSEGDGFNLSRGLEKFTAQNMPTGLTPIQEAATGYDLYYGTDLSVSDETLRDYGIYAPQTGDYTTNGKDSIFLRNIANMTGIPQWQLQTILEGYGGNIGKYVLNVIDKAAGATKDQQGGKGFADTIFSSFTALDKDSASSAFYDGMTQLKKEKNKLLQKIADYNEDLKTASGDAKIEIQNKIQKAKDDFGVKAADFIDRYVSAYNITGGLSKDQAQQIYYLFRLDNDYTIYEEGSPEQYYKSQAEQKFKNQATAMSAPILDKYYNNRIGNVYQDADGVWRRYLSGGTQAMRNSIYGRSEEHMVNLLNILEGKESNLVNLRKKVRDARSAAFEAKDYAKRDKLGYEFDKQVINAISPYINKYGAENILGTNEVLDYLSDWFFVPDSFKRTKRGKYVSLANSGQTDEAFVRPFIKYVFGLPTNYYSYSDTALTSPSLEGLGR